MSIFAEISLAPPIEVFQLSRDFQVELLIVFIRIHLILMRIWIRIYDRKRVWIIFFFFHFFFKQLKGHIRFFFSSSDRVLRA